MAAVPSNDFHATLQDVLDFLPDNIPAGDERVTRRVSHCLQTAIEDIDFFCGQDWGSSGDPVPGFIRECAIQLAAQLYLRGKNPVGNMLALSSGDRFYYWPPGFKNRLMAHRSFW